MVELPGKDHTAVPTKLDDRAKLADTSIGRWEECNTQTTGKTLNRGLIHHVESEAGQIPGH